MMIPRWTYTPPAIEATTTAETPHLYWWATFSDEERALLGGDAIRWWQSLGMQRRMELRAKAQAGEIER